MSEAKENKAMQDSPGGGEIFGLNPDLVYFLTEAIEKGDNTRIRDHVKGMHSADLADFMNQITYEQREKLLDIIGKKLDPEVLIDLESDVKDEVINQLGAEKSAQALVKLDAEDAVHVIEDLERRERQEILRAIPFEQRRELKKGLAYPEDSAGRLMDTDFVAIPKNWDVGQTIDYLRSEEEALPSDFYEIFVIDKEGEPIGSVLVSRVLRNKRDVQINEIMKSEPHIINVNTDQEDVAYMFHKYALASVPVVDDTGKVVGVISVDDVVDIIEEEAEEDIMRLGGIRETDLFSPFVQTSQRRFIWLFINLLTAIAASAIIAIYEDTIQQIVAIAVLMPIVASMAGNAGTQTLTVAVRGIATKELTNTNVRRVILKEIMVALVNGIGFAFIVALVSYFYYGNMQLSVVFAFATIGALLMAGLSGAAIPVLLAKIGIDPAIASGVFLTTITDMSAFFFFLALAAWWLL